MVFRYVRFTPENETVKHRVHCKVATCSYDTFWFPSIDMVMRRFGTHLQNRHPEEVTTIGDIEEMFGKL